MFNNKCGGSGCNDIFMILILLSCCGNNNCGNDCGCDCCPRECDNRKCCECDSNKGCDSCDLLVWILLINCICGGFGKSNCCR